MKFAHMIKLTNFFSPIRILLVLTLFISSIIQGAETKVKLKFNTQNYSFFISDLLLVKDMNVTDISAKIGNTKHVRERKNGEQAFFYDDLGITVLAINGKLRGVTVTLNSDGDKNYVEKSYTGEFNFGKVSVSSKTVKSDFKKLDGFFVCGMPGLCGSKNKKAAIKVLAGFQTSGLSKITYLSFLFN